MVKVAAKNLIQQFYIFGFLLFVCLIVSTAMFYHVYQKCSTVNFAFVSYVQTQSHIET